MISYLFYFSAVIYALTKPLIILYYEACGFCRLRQLRILKIQSIWILMAGFMCSEGFFSLYYIIVNIMQVQEARLIRTCRLYHAYVNFVCVALSLALQQHTFPIDLTTITSLSGLIKRERLTCKADSILDSGALSGWRRFPSIALSMGK